MSYDRNKLDETKRDLNERFGKHKATMREMFVTPRVGRDLQSFGTLIDWREPGNFDLAMTFLVVGNRLIVYGDGGEAIYVWGEEVSPTFLAETDYFYFVKKAQGHSGHIELYDWDSVRVRHHLGEFVKESSFRDAPKEDRLALREWRDSSYSEHEWMMFVHDHNLLHHSAAYDWGKGIHFNAALHWYGLRLAYKQIQEAPKT